MDNDTQKFQIIGRLGNQMFQLAHIYTMLSNSENKNYSISSEFNFDIDVSRLKYKPNSLCIGIHPEYNFLGYFESEDFFDKQIASDIYSIPEELKSMFINKYGNFDNTLFISVRRGDFLYLLDIFVCLNSSFYEDMFKKLNNRYDKIFLSTDDFNWCKENIHIPQDIIYLEDETAYNTVMLASLCKDFIISSSTFSWWCAWLGEKNGGRIICPEHHFKSGVDDESDNIYYPHRWEKVNVDEYCE